MNLQKQRLLLQQLNKKLNPFTNSVFSIPDKGWIYNIRIALNMSLTQFAKKLKIAKQSAKEIEDREAAGSITLNTLAQAADALEMKLVYALVPKDGSLEKLIEKRARKVAEEIVGRTSTTMMLEDQENSPERLEKAIKEKTEELKRELPKYLWD